ncbi:uncharacterized protein LOC143577046 [Bidens hawaiensis]|uniref:uncharacterized protein LOC143577046 n=1 Tax=Bidens hawaiensis TaxID=980011 RepID=UPI00404A4CBA
MKPEVSDGLAKWAIELGDHTIEYKPKATFKGHVIAYFITETTSLEKEEFVSQQSHLGDAEPEVQTDQGEPSWILYTDGASNGDGSGAELILISPNVIELTYAMRLDFPITNNEAEYEALLAGLRMARKIKVQNIKAHVDSLLVANQVKGNYEAKDPKMMEYLKKTHELLQSFKRSEVIHIAQGLNKKADALSKLASVAFDHLAKDAKVETIKKRSISEDTVANIETPEPNWMTPIHRYLQEGIVPDDKQEARILRTRALLYEII